MHRLLAAGGMGFLGSNFISFVTNRYAHYSVLNFDKSSDDSNVGDFVGNPNYDFIHGDTRDWERVKKSFQDCDAFVNFTDESEPDPVRYNPVELFMINNIFSTQVLLEMCKWYRPSRFIQISTCDVYGYKEKGLFKENSPLSPISQHAASRAAAEVIAQSYIYTEVVPVIIVRIANIFGPKQKPTGPSSFIAQMITQALLDKPIRLTATGANKRDWLFVDDCSAALDRILHFGQVGEIYNLGAGRDKTDLQICQKILQILGKPQSLINFDNKGPEASTRVSIATKGLKELGKGYLPEWKPQHSFDKALETTVSWYADNRDLWQART